MLYYTCQGNATNNETNGIVLRHTNTAFPQSTYAFSQEYFIKTFIKYAAPHNGEFP